MSFATWNGALATGAQVMITLEATINPGTAGQVVSNQGTVFWRRAVRIGLGAGLPLTLAASTFTLLSHERQGRLVYLGHGLHDLSSLLLATGIAGAIFLACAQVVASTLWLRFFAMGPLEWLWRYGTYWRCRR